MGLISQIFEPYGVIKFVITTPLLIYSIIFHEIAHGWVANKMGDPTAKWLGRLSLNPIKHLDPIGTIMLLFFGFGWAKPVPVNFNKLTDSRKGLIFVSAAGITVNILIAFIALFFRRQFFETPSAGVISVILGYALGYAAYINIILAAFNLIPIPPLDGSKILMGFSSRRFQYSLARLEPYGFFIIIGLLWLGWLNGPIRFLYNTINGLIELLLQ